MGAKLPGTKKCPFCAEDIKAEAIKCRHCGSDLSGAPMRPAVQQLQSPPVVHVKVQQSSGFFMRFIKLGISLMVLAILASVVGTCFICGKAAHDVAEKSKERHEVDRHEMATATPIEVTASALEAAYEANEVAADGRYKGKVLRVSGIVDRINKDFLDDPHVILRSERIVGGVTCSFGKGSDAAIVSLVKGDRVVLRGMGDGYLMGANLRACVVEDTAAAAEARRMADVMIVIIQYKDKMCACKDNACTKRVSESLTEWLQDQAKSYKDAKFSGEDQKKAAAIGEEMDKCMQKAMGVTATPRRSPTWKRTTGTRKPGAARFVSPTVHKRDSSR